MYWLQPPSLVRRAAAIALVLGAVAWDLWGQATTVIPIAAGPIGPGAVIDATDLEWIDVPVGVIHPPEREPVGSVAAVAIGIGEPIIDAVLTDPVQAPDGWWTVPIVIGTLAEPGDEVMLVVGEAGVSTSGLVLESQIGDPFDLSHRPAAVAVPPASAAIIAAAEQQGLLVTAIRPTPIGR